MKKLLATTAVIVAVTAGQSYAQTSPSQAPSRSPSQTQPSQTQPLQNQPSQTPSQSSPSQSSPMPSGPGGTAGSSTQMNQKGPAGQVTFQNTLQPNQLMASELMDANVYGSEGNSVGDISDVILDPSGQIQAVVLGVGGFLGIGAKTVAVPYRALQISAITPGAGSGTGRQNWNTLNRITLSVSRADLEKAPSFDSSRSATTGMLSPSAR